MFHILFAFCQNTNMSSANASNVTYERIGTSILRELIRDMQYDVQQFKRYQLEMYEEMKELQYEMQSFKQYQIAQEQVYSDNISDLYDEVWDVKEVLSERS